MPTDISTITDLNQLKAMAFDRIATIELAQSNLRNIQTRIREVQTPKPPAEA